MVITVGLFIVAVGLGAWACFEWIVYKHFHRLGERMVAQGVCPEDALDTLLVIRRHVPLRKVKDIVVNEEDQEIEVIMKDG